MVWLFSSVQSHVGLEVSFLIESFAASLVRTDEVLDAIVLLDMDIESLDATVGLIAALDGALVHLDCLMGLKVVFEVASRHEILATPLKLTLEWTIVLDTRL